MKMKKILACVLAVCMIAAVLTACGSSDDESGKGESNTNSSTNSGTNSGTSSGTQTSTGTEASSDMVKSVTLGMNVQVSTLDPWNGASTGTIYIQEALHDSLFHAQALGEPIKSVIGKSYEVSDDNQTITVEIYDYVHDSAGNKITASDVAWSYNTFLATGNATQFSKYLESAEADGDTTVIFHMKPGTCNETSAATSTLTGCVIYAEAAYDEDTWATNPIGCGPYVLENFTTGASVTLKANEDYWQTDKSLRPLLKSQNAEYVIFNIILEDSQLAVALENGDVDAVNYVSPDNLTFFTDGNGNALDGYYLEKVNSILAVNVSFNMNPDGGSPVADDVNLRKAIEWAIDKDALVSTIMGDTGEAIFAFGTPIYGDYNDDWAELDPGYDVETAKEYLAQSDYVANGSPTIRIGLETNDVKVKAAQMIQNYLQAIGINAEVKSWDTALFDNYKYDFSEWDLKIDNNGNRYSIAALWSNFLSSAHTSYNGVPTSFNGIPEGKLSELCGIANNIDTNSQETVDDVFEYLTENAVIYGLWMPVNYECAQDGVTGIAVQALAYPQPWAFTFASDYVGVNDGNF